MEFDNDLFSAVWECACECTTPVSVIISESAAEHVSLDSLRKQPVVGFIRVIGIDEAQNFEHHDAFIPVFTERDLLGSQKEIWTKILTAARPGRPVLLGGLENRAFLVSAINDWDAWAVLGKNSRATAVQNRVTSACLALRQNAGTRRALARLQAETLRLEESENRLRKSQHDAAQAYANQEFERIGQSIMYSVQNPIEALVHELRETEHSEHINKLLDQTQQLDTILSALLEGHVNDKSECELIETLRLTPLKAYSPTPNSRVRGQRRQLAQVISRLCEVAKTDATSEPNISIEEHNNTVSIEIRAGILPEFEILGRKRVSDGLETELETLKRSLAPFATLNYVYVPGSYTYFQLDLHKVEEATAAAA